ncbi:ubiquinone anaerobic biosynthesis accessory factor UbiT [Ramlibacter albus]|uniref:Ubiquinone biosynthesis accessory factor UbiT n=1 Tax=Ramlibacter albus TaxID=2079448 RepID=A0A923S5L2_9BURK|nr:SCP2 sterol-binding domain-containing protein [Ramlibacter albus]
MNEGALQLPPCPKPLAAIFARLPSYPPSALLAAALNIGLASKLPEDVRERLLRKRLRIEVRDARITMDFTWTGDRFRALPRQAQTDLTIGATAPDFLRLAQRQEDPDTLFFSRRLTLEGDTELGLVVKNTLDALELPVLDLTRLRETAARRPPWRS